MPLTTTLVFLLLLSGCGGGSSFSPVATPSPAVEPTRGGGALADGCSRAGNFVTQPGWTGQCSVAPQPKRKWTVLLYVNGANDLEEYGTLNLNQIEKSGSDENVTFVAQFKRIPKSAHDFPDDDDTSDGDWTGTRRLVIRRDKDTAHVSSPIVSTQADTDMGSPQTLHEFVEWGTRTFPAERYAIILWNHGAGWRSRAAKPGATRGFSYDDEKDTHIETNQLADALTLGSGRKWDLIAWDSSLMQMLEVAHEIKNETRWIVGSEESPPSPGYPYDKWVDKLVANPNADGRYVGDAICDAMLSGYTRNSDITQSLLDASKIAPLTAAVNNFGAALLAAKSEHGTAIAAARDMAESYREQYYTNKDLLDFVLRVKETVPDSRVQTTATAVENAAREAIVKNVRGDDHALSQGIAIYIPSPNVYRRNDISQANGFGQRYTELLFAEDAPNWQSFLTQGPP